jgi:hypothetical protein
MMPELPRRLRGSASGQESNQRGGYNVLYSMDRCRPCRTIGERPFLAALKCQSAKRQGEFQP